MNHPNSKKTVLREEKESECYSIPLLLLASVLFPSTPPSSVPTVFALFDSHAHSSPVPLQQSS